MQSRHLPLSLISNISCLDYPNSEARETRDRRDAYEDRLYGCSGINTYEADAKAEEEERSKENGYQF